ncbi:helix-turn-helix domain-containing protein [Campylobacter sp. RM16192]|uniref:helix-turn-helix domain-containing protein n=1 Tax=Campylobacter sp. RM16192 TaxID=1660080 RepID=UPI001451A748|nr:helix-turn-helix domain-containing protein [Campylobacter sp. RM16192]QCD52492.1 putative protein, putative transcriptional regulator [Campylobacter sp. RM16192]
MESLEAIFARIRAVLGIKTDKQMSEILDIPYATIGTWKDRKKIPKGKLFEIANRLEVTPEYLESGINIINGGNNQMGSSNTQNNYGYETNRGKEWDEFVKLFDEYGSKALLKNFIATLKDEKEKFEML